MTLGDLIDAQASFTKFQIVGVVRYQFMRATLPDLCELGLRATQLFDATFHQDQLAYHLLKRRGSDDYVAGRSHIPSSASAWRRKELLCQSLPPRRAFTAI